MGCESNVAGNEETVSEVDREKIAINFQREVYCLFGLPVDNLSLAAVKALIRQRAPLKEKIVLSTININWVARSFSDSEFRSAILNSDLVTLDGKPLVWISKFLGYPMRETAPGSTLILELLEEKLEKPLTIFLFGGDGKAAELAMEQINLRQGGLRAVGALNPGYGSIEEMSSDKIIETINSTRPDILLVALGARKGARWIEKNRHRLVSGVISHLGATINFLAGTVQRAPRSMQQFGLEWVWRILQEPKLFSRYAGDGWVIFRRLVGKSTLWMQYLLLHKKYRQAPIVIHVEKNDLLDELCLSFGRNLSLTPDSHFREMFRDIVCCGKSIIFDFQQTVFIDGAFIGILLIFEQQLANQGKKLRIINLNSELCAMFRLYDYPGLLVRKQVSAMP